MKEQIINFDILDTPAFYDLCQAYRSSTFGDQTLVMKKFNELKTWLKINLRIKQMSPQFVQLTSDQSGLYALDVDGGVWSYHPANGQRFAFWSHLTAHRVDNTGQKKEKV